MQHKSIEMLYSEDFIDSKCRNLRAMAKNNMPTHTNAHKKGQNTKLIFTEINCLNLLNEKQKNETKKKRTQDDK